MLDVDVDVADGGELNASGELNSPRSDLGHTDGDVCFWTSGRLTQLFN